MNLRISFAIVSLLAWSPSMAWAEEDEAPPQEEEDLELFLLDPVEVRTSIIEGTEAIDVFEHAGGRTVIGSEKIERSGANALPDALRKVSGVKVVEATGTGNTDTKLNIGIRGLDPRLTARSMVLLDEIPIVVAPYGQPQASLFPVSLFSIHRIDVVRGGASMRYGPQTVGGVINLVTAPIPTRLETRLASQTDQFGNVLSGLSLGNTSGPLGYYGEYSFRGGESYREHSGQSIHTALLKNTLRLGSNTQLHGLFHFYDEVSELPGGLYPDVFAATPHASERPWDGFRGERQGAALKLSHSFDASLQGEVIAYYNHSFREYTLAEQPGAVATLHEIPRTYQSMAVEPRLAKKFRLGDDSLVVHTGYRFAYETAAQRRFVRGTGDASSRSLTESDDNQLAAQALYAEADLWLLDQSLRLNGGARFESVRLLRRNNLRQTLLGNDYDVLLPGASVWFSPIEELAAFASYSQSFGSPQFVQLGRSEVKRDLQAEVADTAEVGVKLLELFGVEAGATFFHMNFHDQIECDQLTCENVGASIHQGLETEVYLDLGSWIDSLDGVEVETGYTYTDARMVAGPYLGKRAPWAPEHAIWAEVSYSTPIGLAQDSLRLSVDGWWESAQFSDHRNLLEDPQGRGAVGIVDPVFVAGLSARYSLPLNRTMAMEVRGGVKNVFDHPYFYRTDDLNAGLLSGRPFTSWAGLSLKWSPDGLEAR